MPSKSPEQAKLMSAIAHGWHAPMKHAPSMAVAQEFHAADKAKGVYMHADGGKVGTLVNFAKQGTKALMDRLETSFHNPYIANTDQVRDDISKYWRTNAPPVKVEAPAPAMQRIDTSELDNLVNKPPTVPGLAAGGAVDDAPASNRFLRLVRHAADRVSAAVSDDPHHALARVAAGLSSQVAGLSPSGGAQFGRTPGLVDETKSIPAGLIDLGKGAVDVGGAVADRLPTRPGVAAMQAIRDGLNHLQDKYGGDLAPQWSRDAEARATQLHNAVHKSMGLSEPKGFIENGAEAGGMMLGQLPIPGAEAKEGVTGLRGTLSMLKHAVPEWLGPTIRPSLRNYGAGTLAGGLMGAAGSPSQPDAPPPDPDSTSGMKGQFE